MIGCRYLKNGSIVVHDSLSESPIVFSDYSSFEDEYRGKIISFEILRMYDNQPVVMIKED